MPSTNGRDPDWVDGLYARVYYSLQDDQPTVWWDDRMLAWFVRLLVAANQAHPHPAPLPRRLPDDVMLALVASGAIDATDDGMYRVHGLARMRTKLLGRGFAGGVARAGRATRDHAGRFAGPDDAGRDAGRDAGNSRVDAGPASTAPTLDVGGTPPLASGDGGSLVQRPAGPARPAASLVQRASDIDRDSPLETDPSQGPFPGDSLPANGAPAAMSTLGRHKPATLPDCEDPDAHRSSWQKFDGSSWKCPTCIAKRREAEPSFRERMAKYQGDGPF